MKIGDLVVANNNNKGSYDAVICGEASDGRFILKSLTPEPKTNRVMLALYSQQLTIKQENAYEVKYIGPANQYEITLKELK